MYKMILYETCSLRETEVKRSALSLIFVILFLSFTFGTFLMAGYKKDEATLEQKFF